MSGDLPTAGLYITCFDFSTAAESSAGFVRVKTTSTPILGTPKCAFCRERADVLQLTVEHAHAWQDWLINRTHLAGLAGVVHPWPFWHVALVLHTEPQTGQHVPAVSSAVQPCVSSAGMRTLHIRKCSMPGSCMCTRCRACHAPHR